MYPSQQTPSQVTNTSLPSAQNTPQPPPEKNQTTLYFQEVPVYMSTERSKSLQPPREASNSDTPSCSYVPTSSPTPAVLSSPAASVLDVFRQILINPKVQNKTSLVHAGPTIRHMSSEFIKLQEEKEKARGRRAEEEGRGEESKE